MGRVWELSYSSQLLCKCKTVLKTKIYFLKNEKHWEHGKLCKDLVTKGFVGHENISLEILLTAVGSNLIHLNLVCDVIHLLF